MSSYHYLVAPLIAAAALVVLILICRWVFATDGRDERTARRLAKMQSQGDYGLLAPVATTRTSADAAMLRSVLAEAGIRCTVSVDAGGAGHVVLVFRDDALRARQLVST
ncbi:MAG: hypothetical protein JWN88_3044 [Frankiales bacterium]|nr:hypothetical protein [Frankiales bacterium]